MLERQFSWAAAIRWSRLLALGIFFAGPVGAQSLADIVERIKPSIVAVGTYQPTRQPAYGVRGTGFVIGDGRTVATNAHVLPSSLDVEHRETLAVFFHRGGSIERRTATRLKTDVEHDIALLRIEGAPMPSLALDRGETVREGQSIAFTGFPLGAALGLRPVTHTGIVSAITPIARPAERGSELSTSAIRRLRNPYDVLQLDADAYPGNSGSPVYIQSSGAVIGILNMVYVKETKEYALRRPSGIAYAIPVEYLRDLLR